MIYLTSSRDWNNWFSVAKFTDLSLKIWDYVNSDNSKNSVLSTDSSSSAVFQIKAGATTILDLEDDKLSCYSYLHEMWKKKKTVYKKIEQNLILFHNYFYFTINVSMIDYLIKNENSLYQIMKVLKNEYCMLIEMHWKNILDCYIVLKQFSKNEDLVLWCDKWLKVYNDFKKTDIVKFNTAKQDFYDVNMKINSFFISVYIQNYNSFEFKTLITEFKKHYKINSYSKQLFSSQTSFAASLQKQIQSSQNEKLINEFFNTCMKIQHSLLSTIIQAAQNIILN